MGTAATSQVVGEALGMSLPHSALSPSGAPIWRDMARRSALAVMAMEQKGLTLASILTEDSLHNAMVAHAAVGGSTNLVVHVPAIAHAAGLRRPTVDDWTRINALVPRLVDVLPNGPTHFATVQVFLAGGVPEMMLHLRDLGLLKLDALTVTGQSLGENLAWWEKSERRARLREKLRELDRVDPDRVILAPARARAIGMTSTVSFLRGNLAPEGALVKSTAIDPTLLDADGVFAHEGPARVFGSEAAAMVAIKSRGPDALRQGEIVVLIGLGPAAGMPETYQVTSALKYLPKAKGVVLLTDGRFSGVSTGPCIGHMSPESAAGGPLGKLRDGDLLRVRIDTRKLEGSVNFIGTHATPELAAAELAARPVSEKLAPNPAVPADTDLWAALQSVSGGSWGGCVYDVPRIKELLAQGLAHSSAPVPFNSPSP
jgi:putative YjhG/YagF family dehydratase